MATHQPSIYASQHAYSNKIWSTTMYIYYSSGFHRSAKTINTAFNGFSCLCKSEIEVEVANVGVLDIGGLPLFFVREGFYRPLDVIRRPVRMSDFLRSSIFIRVV